MTTTWRPAGRARERIIAFGIEGSGKTYDYFTIARKTPGDMMWIIDTDNSTERMLETDFTDVGVYEEWRSKDHKDGVMQLDDEWCVEDGSVVIFHAENWEELKWSVDRIRNLADKNDWIIIDSVSLAWDMVQSWYTRQVFGSNIDEYFMRIRMEVEAKNRAGGKGNEQKSLGAFEGWVDWSVINPQHKSTINDLLQFPPCHLFACAEVQALNKEDNDRATRQLFGRLGIKPKGQKRIGHNVQTIIYKSMTGQGDGEAWKATTLKDRGRSKFDGEEIEDFALTYLFKQAGWRPMEVGA